MGQCKVTAQKYKKIKNTKIFATKHVFYMKARCQSLIVPAVPLIFKRVEETSNT